MFLSDFERQMHGFGLTTANIFYRMPDHPTLIQEFLWQFHDTAPAFPELTRFLAFWRREIDGDLHSVRVAHKKLIGPSEWRSAAGEYLIH